MITVTGQIDSIDILPQTEGVPPKPDDATIVVNVHEPNDGTLTIKLYPEATRELAVGPCRVLVDHA